MEAELRTFLADLKNLRVEVKGETHERIAKKSIRNHAKQLASQWFTMTAKNAAENYTFAPELIEGYSGHWKRLIKLTENNNYRASYLDILNNLTRHFRDDFILPLQRNEIQQKKTSLSLSVNSSPASPTPTRARISKRRWTVLTMVF